VLPRHYFTHSVYEVVLQKSIPEQIRHLFLTSVMKVLRGRRECVQLRKRTGRWGGGVW
jgi:hypothetical protein